jgi:uncharacterized membrane protein YcaP (DUF421 family)
MLAAIFAIMLMPIFYFAIGYFVLKFIFKKTVDPMLLLNVIALAAIGIAVGRQLWYHQPLNTSMLLSALIVIIIFLRRIRRNESNR